MTKYYCYDTHQRFNWVGVPPTCPAAKQLTTKCVTAKDELLLLPLQDTGWTGWGCTNCANVKKCKLVKREHEFYGIKKENTTRITKAKAIALLI